MAREQALLFNVNMKRWHFPNYADGSTALNSSHNRKLHSVETCSSCCHTNAYKKLLLKACELCNPASPLLVWVRNPHTLCFKNCDEAHEVIQQGRVLATKSDAMSSIPGTHIVEGENLSMPSIL